jgi:molybdopterin-guanine dinucleotide biosynthesis protein A
MPVVTAALVGALAEGLDSFDAFLPESGGRRGMEPLCAAYGPACRPAIELSLSEGDRRAIAFHRHVRVGILREPAVRAIGNPDLLFFNVNTANDLRAAEELT